jgi:hypothetical protein
MPEESRLESTYMEADEQALAFLVSERGFQRLDRKGSNIGFNTEVWETTYCKRAGHGPGSPTLYVRLAISLRDGVDLQVSRDGSNWYEVQDLERCVRPQDWQVPRDPIVGVSGYAKEIDKLATRLCDAGARFFSGDETLWDALAAAREERRTRPAPTLIKL